MGATRDGCWYDKGRLLGCGQGRKGRLLGCCQGGSWRLLGVGGVAAGLLPREEGEAPREEEEENYRGWEEEERRRASTQTLAAGCPSDRAIAIAIAPGWLEAVVEDGSRPEWGARKGGCGSPSGEEGICPEKWGRGSPQGVGPPEHGRSLAHA